MARAQSLLSRFGLYKQDQLTARGRAVAALPVHPRVGHMLTWAAEHGAARLACRLAVQLEEQSRGSVDLEPELKTKLPSHLQRRASQLEQLLNTKDAEDALAHSQWLVVAELGGSGSQLRVFKALELNIDELEQHSPELFTPLNHIDWDNKQQRVLAERRLMLEELVVESSPLQNLSNADRALGLVSGVRRTGLHCLPWNDECREWQARVGLMRTLKTQGQTTDWPIVDDETLLNNLEEWLLPWLDGIGSIKALQQLNLQKTLNAMLDYQQQTLLDQWLPKRYKVPSGSQIALSYLQPGNPVLSVRLQEMLGCSENPSVAKGQIPLKVELLS